MRKLVPLCISTTFIVLKVWNNQLHQPPYFIFFFSVDIGRLEFRDFLFLHYQSKRKQERKCQLNRLLHILIFLN